MVQGPGNRRRPICSKICSLLICLTKEPSKYKEISPKIEYWIEYVLREGFATVDELVEGVSVVAWDDGGSFESVGRFLKEFRDAPHRSEQARSFVAQLCPYVLRWFAVASVEDLWSTGISSEISYRGVPGFMRAAAFVGHNIRWDLLSNDLVRQHLIKPLINHHNNEEDNRSAEAVRANAIYQLFTAAGNTLLQGLLEVEDVQVCFEIFNSRCLWIRGFDSSKLQEFHKIHSKWVLQKEAEEKTRGTEEHQVELEEDTVAAEVPAEVKTPVVFVPQDLPVATIGIEIPSSILQDLDSSSVFNAHASPETFTDVPSGTVSPTLSFSTESDLTPTELGEEIESDDKQTATRHDTLYFEDGNVEIACGETVFRVHSSVISLSSSELREILSQSALLGAPTPEGRPRITISDSAEDFAILLKTIYTPGFPARNKVPEFSVFASLLRMTTKYGFSDVRDQLLDDLKGAYPTGWEDFRSAKVLGEDVFGSPKPHPNAVLNLFEDQNIRFAIPFAAYRASIGGFQALMSDKLGTILLRRSLATTVHGMHVISTSVSNAARMIAYGGCLSKCPDKGCTLNADINPVEKRIEALEKVYSAMIEKRKCGLLSPPSLSHLLCTKCAKRVERSHTEWGSFIWEKLPLAFSLSHSWDGL